MTPATNHARDLEAAVRVLECAAGRIEANGWARTSMARDRRGRATPSTSDEAVRWSLLGAVHVELDRCVYGRHKEDRVYQLVLDALEAVKPGWRDWHEQEGRKAREAVALAQRAAKRLRKGMQP